MKKRYIQYTVYVVIFGESVANLQPVFLARDSIFAEAGLVAGLDSLGDLTRARLDSTASQLRHNSYTKRRRLVIVHNPDHHVSRSLSHKRQEIDLQHCSITLTSHVLGEPYQLGLVS